jgi:hypothetical protein
MDNIFSLYRTVMSLINQAIYLIIGLAVLGFLWGIVKLILNLSNAQAKQEAKTYMLYGIITIFIMTSAWGIVNILTVTLSRILNN